MRIGQLSVRTKVSVKTIRYYEERGLLLDIDRSLSGHRLYQEETVSRIQFIKSCQEHGFTLGEVLKLLELRRSPPHDCGRARAILDSKIAQLDAKARELKRASEALQELKQRCGCSPERPECIALT